MTPKMRAKILDLLARHKNMTIATVRPDGYPQATTVGYANDGLTIYFGCAEDSQKAKNLALNSKVSIAIDRDYENWNEIQGLSLAGTAARVTDADEIKKAGALFLDKFPQMAAFSEEELLGTVIFRVTPSVISVLDYTKGFGHSDLVTV
jgi:nitroimidazol reductase NimA-like FMN-containing flavoprotein (pyridoxamine 5'-phosphate oxidase superfamily)